MVKHTFIFFLCIGLSASLPATKLELVADEPVQNDTTKVEVGTTHTGRVEVTLPYKVMSKEELVTWVTYAMRLMASKINITLADTDPIHTPPEKIEKLRNSSEAINHFLEKVNTNNNSNIKAEKKVMDKGKMKTVAMSSKHGPMCKHLEKQLKLTATTEKPSDSKANLQNQKYDFLNPPPPPPAAPAPVQNHAENFFSKMIMESQKAHYNPSLKLVQELALTNPYDHPDNKIFRDPNIFPPFNIQQQSPYLPLPVTPSYNEERLKEFYAMANIRNHTDPFEAMDPLRGLQLVPMRANFQHNPMHIPQMPHMTRTEIDDLNSGSLAYQQQTSADPHSPHKPILRVPFEAFITITRETSTPVPSFTTPLTQSPPPLKSSSSAKYSKKNRNRDRDNHHQASTDNIPDTLPPNRKASKNKNISKTTIEFEDEVVTEKTVTEKKKKKSKKSKKQPSIFGTILRMVTGTINKNSSTNVANIFGKVSKKLPNPKVSKGTLRGKRNETKTTKTSQRQGDYDDENGGDDDNGNGNGNGNDDDDDFGNGNGADDERDIFDDDDDRFNDDYDYDGGGGSLGSLEDLLPLVIPILEDISDPESETDLVEFLQAAVPLLQGLSEPDPETGEGVDIVGVLLPILLGLSEGKDGMGSDSGAILGPLLQLIGPFIGPLSGPLIGPLSASSSGGAKGSNIGMLLSALLGPLSTPIEPGGKSPIAILTANIVSILSKQLSSPDSGVDIGKLVSQLVGGVLQGTSAGLSGGSSKHISESKEKDEGGYEYGPATGYGAPAAQQVEIFEPPPQTFPRPPRIMRQPSKSSTQKKKTSSTNILNRFQPEPQQYRPQATHVELVEIPQDLPIVPPAIIHKEQLAEAAHYGYGPPYGVPANKVNPFQLLGKALKDILASGVNLFSAVLGASTASAGASSQESSGGSSAGSSDDGGYQYGPPPSHYGPPPMKYGPPPPSKYGAPKPYQKPDSYQNIRI